MRKTPEPLRRVFHELWTRDVGTSGYEKGRWRLLDLWLETLVRACPEGSVPERLEGS